MEWWITLIIFILVVCGIISLIAIELRDSRIRFERSKIELEKYKEILDMDDDGFCSGCDYGKDNCMKEGRAYCKTLQEVNKDE